MKKFITAFFFICIFMPFICYSNPTEPSPIITEIYFDENDEWTLEFYIDEFFYSWYINTDSLRINTAIIKDEVLIEIGVVYLITPEMVIGNLDITRNSGYLHVDTWDGGWTQLDWGISWNGPPVLQGQSWAVQICWDYWQTSYAYYYLCHSYPPSLGSDLYFVNGHGTLQGYIYDLNHNPIPNVQFYCNAGVTYPMRHFFSSNDSGYFSCNFLSHSYTIYYDYADPYFSDYFNLWIEIDSVYNLEIIAPVYITGIEKNKDDDIEIIAYPNPAKDIVHFQISIPPDKSFGLLQLVICDAKGKIIDRLDAGETMISWQAPASGLYYHYLDIEKRKSVPGKFIVSK